MLSKYAVNQCLATIPPAAERRRAWPSFAELAHFWHTRFSSDIGRD
jgi:hypothetical protein